MKQDALILVRGGGRKAASRKCPGGMLYAAK